MPKTWRFRQHRVLLWELKNLAYAGKYDKDVYMAVFVSSAKWAMNPGRLFKWLQQVGVEREAI